MKRIQVKHIANIAGISERQIRNLIDEDPDFPKPEIAKTQTKWWNTGEILAF